MFSQTTKKQISQIFSRSILFSLMLLLALSPALQAQGLNRNTARKVVDASIMVEPLARTDARAQLDPALAAAQPMPAAEAQEAFVSGEPTVLDYDQATGQETRTTGQINALTEDMQSSAGTPGVRPLAELAEAHANNEQAENFLCVDDKVAIHSTAYPWSTQVKLFMTFPNGGTYVGSGSIISSKYVITHKNNLFWAPFGGWATRVEVIPALDGFYKPFGSAFSVRLRWYNHGASNIGLITLDRHIGFSTGTLGYGAFSDATVKAYAGNIAGYPISKNAGRVLYYDFGATTTLSYDQARVNVLFLAGELGAGNYFRNNVGARYVFGVSANAYYCATTSDRITSWIYSQLSGVIASGL